MNSKTDGTSEATNCCIEKCKTTTSLNQEMSTTIQDSALGVTIPNNLLVDTQPCEPNNSASAVQLHVDPLPPKRTLALDRYVSDSPPLGTNCRDQRLGKTTDLYTSFGQPFSADDVISTLPNTRGCIDEVYTPLSPSQRPLVMTAESTEEQESWDKIISNPGRTARRRIEKKQRSQPIQTEVSDRADDDFGIPILVRREREPENNRQGVPSNAETTTSEIKLRVYCPQADGSVHPDSVERTPQIGPRNEPHPGTNTSSTSNCKTLDDVEQERSAHPSPPTLLPTDDWVQNLLETSLQQARQELSTLGSSGQVNPSSNQDSLDHSAPHNPDASDNPVDVKPVVIEPLNILIKYEMTDTFPQETPEHGEVIGSHDIASGTASLDMGVAGNPLGSEQTMSANNIRARMNDIADISSFTRPTSNYSHAISCSTSNMDDEINEHSQEGHVIHITPVSRDDLIEARTEQEIMAEFGPRNVPPKEELDLRPEQITTSCTGTAPSSLPESAEDKSAPEPFDPLNCDANNISKYTKSDEERKLFLEKQIKSKLAEREKKMMQQRQVNYSSDANRAPCSKSVVRTDCGAVKAESGIVDGTPEQQCLPCKKRENNALDSLSTRKEQEKISSCEADSRADLRKASHHSKETGNISETAADIRKGKPNICREQKRTEKLRVQIGSAEKNSKTSVKKQQPKRRIETIKSQLLNKDKYIDKKRQGERSKSCSVTSPARASEISTKCKKDTISSASIQTRRTSGERSHERSSSESLRTSITENYLANVTGKKNCGNAKETTEKGDIISCGSSLKRCDSKTQSSHDSEASLSVTLEDGVDRLQQSAITYAEYCYPPIQVQIPETYTSYREDPFSSGFETLDAKVCQLYQDFQEKYKEKERHSETLKKHTSNRIIANFCVVQLKKLDKAIARLHVRIECIVTFYETKTTSATRMLSQYQRSELIKVMDSLENMETVHYWAREDDKENHFDKLKLLEQKRREILNMTLIPRLPRDSTGNDLAFLIPILEEEKESSHVQLFLTEKISRLREREPNFCNRSKSSRKYATGGLGSGITGQLDEEIMSWFSKIFQ